MKLNVPQYDYGLLKSYGEDVFISDDVEIRRPHLVSVGNHVAIDSGFYCTTAAEIGDYIHIADHVSVIGGEHGTLKMEHFSFVGGGSRIICCTDSFAGDGLIGPTIPEQYRVVKYGSVLFKRFSGLGSCVTVTPGVFLAEGSCVAACSLLMESTRPWMLYKGTPAKPFKGRRPDKILAAAKELGYL